MCFPYRIKNNELSWNTCLCYTFLCLLSGMSTKVSCPFSCYAFFANQLFLFKYLFKFWFVSNSHVLHLFLDFYDFNADNFNVMKSHLFISDLFPRFSRFYYKITCY